MCVTPATRDGAVEVCAPAVTAAQAPPAAPSAHPQHPGARSRVARAAADQIGIDIGARPHGAPEARRSAPPAPACRSSAANGRARRRRRRPRSCRAHAQDRAPAAAGAHHIDDLRRLVGLPRLKARVAAAGSRPGQSTKAPEAVSGSRAAAMIILSHGRARLLHRPGRGFGAVAGSGDRDGSRLGTARHSALTRDGGIAAHVQASADALAAEGLELQSLPRKPRIPRASGRDVLESAGCSTRPARGGSVRRSGLARAGCDPPAPGRRPGCGGRAAPARPGADQRPRLYRLHLRRLLLRPGRECTSGARSRLHPEPRLRGCAHTQTRVACPAPTADDPGRAGLHGADMAVSYSSAVDRHLANNGISPRRIVPLFTTMQPPP